MYLILREAAALWASLRKPQVGQQLEMAFTKGMQQTEDRRALSLVRKKGDLKTPVCFCHYLDT